MSSAAEKGKIIFEGKAGCVSCHPGELKTDMNKYDVGTGTGREAGTEFDTPTCVEIWRTAPYLYLGQAVTLKEIFTKFNKNDEHGQTSNLKPEELDNLIAYLRSL